MRASRAVLACLVASTTACMPVKPTDPGIPATPCNFKCDVYRAATPAECNAAQPWACSDTQQPIITPCHVRCPLPDHKVLILLTLVNGVYTHASAHLEAVCANNMWTDVKDPSFPFVDPPVPLNMPVWACSKT